MSNELAEPHGRHARLHADHLEVLEEPSRPSADFFHTLTSRCAPPSAWVNSATSASSCSSRDEGPDLPATRAILPASKNSTFHHPIDCSLTFSLRAASAIDNSPASTLNTIRAFFSTGIKGGLPMLKLSLRTYTTPLPHNLTRDTNAHLTTKQFTNPSKLTSVPGATSMNIYPDFGALGDNTTLQNVIGALLTFVLITAVFTMLISAIAWASAASGNHTIAAKARAGLLIALGAAALAGAGVTWISWFINLSDQL